MMKLFTCCCQVDLFCAMCIDSAAVFPVKNWSRSVQRVGNRPFALFPLTLPSITSFSILPERLAMWPKYLRYDWLIFFKNLHFTLSSCKIELFVRCCVHEILSTIQYTHSSKLSILFLSACLIVYISAAYVAIGYFHISIYFHWIIGY